MKIQAILVLTAMIATMVKGQPGPPPPNFFQGRPPPPEVVEQIIRNQQQAAMSQFPPNILQAAFMAENGIAPFEFNRPGSDFPPGFQQGPPRPDDTLAFQPGPPRPENFGGPIPPPPVTQSTPERPQIPQPRPDNAPTTDRKVIPIHFDHNPIRPEPSEGPRVSVVPAPPHLKPHKLDYLRKEEKLKDAQRVIFPTGSISPVDTLQHGQFRDKLIKASDKKPKPSVLVIPLPRPKTKKEDVKPEKRFTPSPGPYSSSTVSRKIEDLERLRGSHSHRQEFYSERPRYTPKQTEFRLTPPSSFEERNLKTPPASTHSFYKPKFEYGFKPLSSDQEDEESRHHEVHSDGSVTRNRFSSAPPRQEKSRQYSSFLGKRPVPPNRPSRPSDSSRGNRYRDEKERDPYTADESVETGTNFLGTSTVRDSQKGSKPVVTLTFDCKGGKDLGWCVLGDRYPRSEVDHIVDECEEVIEAMYVDSVDEWGNHTLSKQRGGTGTWSWSEYVDEPLCSSDRKVIRPAFAKDVNGNWHVVIQTEKYMQKVPTVICRNADAPCNHLSSCGIRSKCIQKYAHRLLVSIDPSKPQECPGMRLYKFPSDCVCHSISSASGSYH